MKNLKNLLFTLIFKISLLSILLSSSSSFAYEIDRDLYLSMSGEERLCVRLIRGSSQGDFFAVISAWFDNDLTDHIFGIKCTDPITGLTLDPLRMALENPFLVEFDDLKYKYSYSFWPFSDLLDGIMDKKCIYTVKHEKDNLTIIEYAETILTRLDIEKAKEKIIDNYSFKYSNIKRAKSLLESIIDSMKYYADRIDEDFDPVFECPTW